MDLLTAFGILCATIAILGGQYLEGGSIHTLINGPACLIVIGGSISAIIIQTPGSTLIHSLRLLKWVFFPPKLNHIKKIQSLRDYSNLVRSAGLVGLERVLNYEKDPLLMVGLQSLSDGVDPKLMKEILEVQVESNFYKNMNASKVYEGLGGYSPTIGVIGAVLGLIQVMGHLSSPESLGSGIAVAFVATIYGIAFANLFCFPIYKKLKNISEQQARYKQMLIEGLMSVAQGQHPNLIETKLRAYINE